MSSAPATLKRTALHAAHVRHGGRLVEYAGWEMPVEYSGITDEHLAVRSRAGLFDVSHMGQIELAGSDALAALQWLISNDGSSLIAMACRHRGLVLLSEWGLRSYLRSGELVQVTLDQPVSVGRGGESGIYLLYLQPRYRIPKVRVAVEFLVEQLGEAG